MLVTAGSLLLHLLLLAHVLTLAEDGAAWRDAILRRARRLRAAFDCTYASRSRVT
jgi:hypothetical protein